MRPYLNPQLPEHDQDDGSTPERPAKRLKETRPNDSTGFREVGLMRDSFGLSSASFVGSSSGIHFIRSVYGVMAGRTPHKHTTDQTPESNLVPGEDDRLDPGLANSTPKPLWYAHEVASPDSEAVQFEDIISWTASYFDYWHPAFPFLHAPSLLQSFEAFARDGIPCDHSFELIIMKAIISIGISDRRQNDISFRKPVPSNLAFPSFEAALQSAEHALTRPATIISLQAVICVQLFLVSMLRLNAASRLGGLVIRMTFQLGLHRCPARFQAFSFAEQQLRQRLFWSIYCIDRHICQSLGLPLTIRDDDVDVCYPDVELHPTMNGRTGSSQRPPPDSRLKLLSLLAKHAQIRGLIMELRNKRMSERNESSDKATLINAKITQWWNQVEDTIEQAELQDAPLTKLHKVVLEVLKHESIIALNRPLLAASKTTADYTGALHTCISASKSVLSILQTSIGTTSKSIVSPKETVEAQIPLLWPSFTWAVWMSSFIMIYAATEKEVDPQIAVRSTDRSLKIFERLASRGSVWPNGCAVAISDLRSALNQVSPSPEKQASMQNGQNSNQDSSYFGSGTRGNGTRRPSAAIMPLREEYQQGRANYDSTSRPSPRTHWSAKSPPNHDTNTISPQNTSSGEQYAFDTSASVRSLANSRPSISQPTFQGLHGLNQEPSVESVFGNSQTGFSSQPSMATGTPVRQWPDMRNLEFDTVLPTLPMDASDPFQGFDIPFWMGQDNYSSWMGE